MMFVFRVRSFQRGHLFTLFATVASSVTEALIYLLRVCTSRIDYLLTIYFPSVVF